MNNQQLCNGDAVLYRYHVLLLVETTNHFGRTIVDGIRHFALENGWLLSFEQRGRFDPVGSLRSFRNFDGIISRTYFRDAQKQLSDSDVPYVELVRGHERPIEVTMDEVKQSQLVFNHFHERGIRHFAWYQMESLLFENRRNSFIEEVNAHGFECHVCSVSKRRSNYIMPRWREQYRSNLHKWILSLPKPVGIYTAIDQHAQYILESCNELEIPVPRSVAVVGVENDEWFCQIQKPSLSSVDTAGHTIGYTAAGLLEKKMNGTYKDLPTVLVPYSFLAIRQSSDFYAIDDQDILDALTFIRENACNRIDTNDVVDAIGISRRSLYRKFEHYLRRTPQEEIMRVRIETAKILLRDTNLFIASIALRTGFSTPTYFVHVFRKETGITPNQYRQTYLYGNEASTCF